MRRWTSVLVVLCACSDDEARRQIEALEKRVGYLESRATDLERDARESSMVIDARFRGQQDWLGLSPDAGKAGWWCVVECQRIKEDCEVAELLFARRVGRDRRECRLQRVAWCTPETCFADYSACHTRAPGAMCPGFE